MVAPPSTAAFFSDFAKNDEKFMCLFLSLKENKFTVRVHG
jgi:hypothetical protein